MIGIVVCDHPRFAKNGLTVATRNRCVRIDLKSRRQAAPWLGSDRRDFELSFRAASLGGASVSGQWPSGNFGDSTRELSVAFLGPACLYGQVIKTRRNDRIIKVERRTLIGDSWRFEETLRGSEDSSKLNTLSSSG
jgi:hypothetical protein